MSPQAADTTLIGLVAAGFIVGWALYLLPAIVAFRRRHPDRWFIALANLILGASGVGWVIALIWALRLRLPASAIGAPSSATPQLGGPLNRSLTLGAALAEIERLNALRAGGYLSEDEFAALKTDILRQMRTRV